MRRLLIVLILAALVALPGAAQVPRTLPDGSVPYWSMQVRQWIKTARFNQTVTVDPSGAGDYTTLAAAITYVGTQTRNYDDYWTIELMPGAYTASAAVTVPTYTKVRCSTAGLGGVVGVGYNSPCQLTSTLTTGTLVTLAGDGSALEGVDLIHLSTYTGNLVAIAKSGSGTGALANVSVTITGPDGGFTTTAVLNSGTGGALYTDNVGITLYPSGSNVTVYRGTSDSQTTLWGGRISQNGSGFNRCFSFEDTSQVRLLWPRVDAGGTCTTGLYLASGAAAWLWGYVPSSIGGTGSLTSMDSASADAAGTVRFGLAAGLPSTCESPQLAVVTGTVATLCGAPPCLCACTASDTWGCAALAEL